MLKALEELKNFEIMCDGYEGVAEESIIYCYVGLRLKPLVGIAGLSANRINNIAEHIIKNYTEKEISLDYMINAIYNFVNYNKYGPSDRYLTDDIEAFLEDYAEEYTDATE